MRPAALATALLLGVASQAVAQQKDLVPPGWVRVSEDSEGQRYASPDGRATLVGSASPAERAVREEVSAVAGVENVDVDLVSKVVAVRGAELDDRALRAAISEAGYEAQ